MKKLIIIIRSISKQKMNSGIIIVSLSIGIACFNLIALFIRRELNTDSFHNAKERIFALKCDDPWIPGSKMYHCKFGSAEYMKENFALVEDFCRIGNASVQKIVVNNNEYFDQPRIIAVSGNFFGFFSYDLLTKNSGTALESTQNIVISESLSQKYFGSDEAAGQVIKLINGQKEEQMVVTGVFKTPVENTQIRFDMVRLIREADSRCYVKLARAGDKDEVEKLLEDHKKSVPIVNMGTPGLYYLESFKSAYFNTSRSMTIEANRDKTDLWIALLIGLMIIGIASFNYMGLLNNRSAIKSREYVIRRINGGSKNILVFDYMIENGIIIGISFLLSIFLMLEMLPFFNELTGSKILESYIYKPENFTLLLIVLLFLFLLTFIFGAFNIHLTIETSTFKPCSNLRNNSTHIPAFNIFQIASSIALIICSIVIVRQMHFISKKPIGLDKEVIEVKLPSQHSDKVSVFREELLKNSSVLQVSVVNASPLLEHFILLLEYEQDGVKKQYSPSGFSGDENYLSVMGIELVEGEGFFENTTSTLKRCVINQVFADLFPYRDLVGELVPGMDDMIITGIVRDFHFSSLKSMIEPAFISFSRQGSHLMVKPSANQVEQSIEAITEIWENQIPGYPLNIESVSDRYEWYHRGNKNYLKLVGACSIISMFLSMIGLFAISYQKSQMRIKEIGIRKINGAGIFEIFELLNGDFLKWVTLSLIIACPVAWFAMHKWLQNFAYKTSLSWWIFAISGLAALGITLITVSWQSWRAATRNPVEVLRYE